MSAHAATHDSASTTTATEPDSRQAVPLDLTAELAALQAARLRRIGWRRDANAEHREARQHGLRIRHAAKLARLASGDDTPEAGT